MKNYNHTKSSLNTTEGARTAGATKSRTRTMAGSPSPSVKPMRSEPSRGRRKSPNTLTPRQKNREGLARQSASRSTSKHKHLTFSVMCAITVIWGLIVLGLVSLQALSGRTGEAGSKNSKNNSNVTSGLTEAENLLPNRFTDENGLSRAENGTVITLAAEVVKIMEERGFKVGEVIVPKGQLREFDLAMNREETNLEAEVPPVDEDASPASTLTTSIRLRCSTTRLAAATAADAIHVFDLWLDGDIAASEYIDIRTPMRAFYK